MSLPIDYISLIPARSTNSLDDFRGGRKVLQPGAEPLSSVRADTSKSG